MITQAAAWQVMSTGPGGPGKYFDQFYKLHTIKTHSTLPDVSSPSYLVFEVKLHSIEKLVDGKVMVFSPLLPESYSSGWNLSTPKVRGCKDTACYQEFCVAVGGSLGLGLGGPADYSLSTPAPAQWSGVPVLAKTGEIASTEMRDL